MGKNALYAGSFDPVTNGHLNIIERAAAIFDSLTVAVVINPNKTGLFTIDERVGMIEEVTKNIPQVKVDRFSGLLADYVNEKRFDVCVRGLRSVADFESELQMEQVNSTLYTEGAQTVFLMTDPALSFISSSLVKEVALLGGSVDKLVPPYVAERIRDKLQEEKQ